jgi:hypothetical protein
MKGLISSQVKLPPSTWSYPHASFTNKPVIISHLLVTPICEFVHFLSIPHYYGYIVLNRLASYIIQDHHLLAMTQPLADYSTSLVHDWSSFRSFSMSVS